MATGPEQTGTLAATLPRSLYPTRVTVPSMSPPPPHPVRGFFSSFVRFFSWCCRARAGLRRIAQTIPELIEGAPYAAQDGLVYLGSKTTRVYAVNQATGELRNKYLPEAEASSCANNIPDIPSDSPSLFIGRIECVSFLAFYALVDLTSFSFCLSLSFFLFPHFSSLQVHAHRARPEEQPSVLECYAGHVRCWCFVAT
jgi:hypothetical protein